VLSLKHEPINFLFFLIKNLKKRCVVYKQKKKKKKKKKSIFKKQFFFKLKMNIAHFKGIVRERDKMNSL